MPLRVAAISFLNPAPLLYAFQHEPLAGELSSRYTLHYTSPAVCAMQLLSGQADLGLIPVAALTSRLAVVPGCTIASLREVRSILLLVKNPHRRSRNDALREVRTLTTDAASRSSTAYAAVLFKHFAGHVPHMDEHGADAVSMLAHSDAALLIGDPALLAKERCADIEARVGMPLLWLDIAALWHEAIGLPWVAAVWAVRPESLEEQEIPAKQLIHDLIASRDAGLRHIEDLVREWTPRVALPPAVIRDYLTRNISYYLDSDCLRAVQRFRELAAKTGVLPPLPELRLL